MLESQKKGVHNLEMLEGKGYEYNLEHYTQSLSVLTVRASSPDSPNHCIHITFQTTLYIQMPIHWAEGDFYLATPDKKAEIVAELGLSEIQHKQLLLIAAQPSMSPEILVLCHQVFLSQEIPIP